MIPASPLNLTRSAGEYRPDVGHAAVRNAGQHEQISAVARQFEAIFIRQMLAAARQSETAGGILGDDPGSQTFRQMRDEHFADIAAGQSMFGLAAMIEQQLTQLSAAQAMPTDRKD